MKVQVWGQCYNTKKFQFNASLVESLQDTGIPTKSKTSAEQLEDNTSGPLLSESFTQSIFGLLAQATIQVSYIRKYTVQNNISGDNMRQTSRIYDIASVWSIMEQIFFVHLAHAHLLIDLLKYVLMGDVQQDSHFVHLNQTGQFALLQNLSRRNQTGLD